MLLSGTHNSQSGCFVIVLNALCTSAGNVDDPAHRVAELLDCGTLDQVLSRKLILSKMVCVHVRVVNFAGNADNPAHRVAELLVSGTLEALQRAHAATGRADIRLGYISNVCVIETHDQKQMDLSFQRYRSP